MHVPPQQQPQQQQIQTPVFRTPQPPGLLPPSWNKPPTTNATTAATPTSAVSNVTRTPGSVGPQNGNGNGNGSVNGNGHVNGNGNGNGNGKVSFLPPRALSQQHQNQLHPHAPQRLMASPVSGYPLNGTPAQPIDIDRTEREGSHVPPPQSATTATGPGIPSTPIYRVPSASIHGTPHATPSGASIALLNVQGMAPPRPSPTEGQQTMYLPNGQGMVIMRQTPPSPHRHQPNTQGIQQMQEWRRGVMMPGIEAGQPQWGEVPDVGSCLLPGEVTNRLGEFAWALKETSVVSPKCPFSDCLADLSIDWGFRYLEGTGAAVFCCWGVDVLYIDASGEPDYQDVWYVSDNRWESR